MKKNNLYSSILHVLFLIATVIPTFAQFEQTTQIEYDDTNYQVRKIKTLNSDGTWKVTTYRYCFDETQTMSVGNVFVNIPTRYGRLTLDGNISNPIKVTETLERLIGGTNYVDTLSVTQTLYSWFNYNNVPVILSDAQGSVLWDQPVFPSKIIKKIGNLGSWQTLIEFTNYDAKGNILAYKTQDGQVQNFTYYGVSDLGKVNLVKTASNNLGHINSYDYKALVGLLSMKDVNGKITSYTYDTFQRLKTISDQIGTLKEYSYHYAGQPIENAIVTSPTIPNLSCVLCTPSIYLTLDASKLITTSPATTLTTNVSSNVGAWTMTSSDASWLTVTGTGNNNGILTMKTTANTGGNPRYGTITVSSSVGGITQKLIIGQSSATKSAREAVLETMEKATSEPNEDLQLVIAPNPNNGLFKAQFVLPESLSININVVDSQGSSVYSQDLLGNEGANELLIQLDKQPAGVYFLLLTYKNKQVATKILKW